MGAAALKLWRWRVRFAADGNDVVALVMLSQWLQLDCRFRLEPAIAFSIEVDTGSRQENAVKARI